MMLNDDQKRVIDGMPIRNLVAVIDDFESHANTMSTSYFFLAVHPLFTFPNVNATPEVTLAYCKESLQARNDLWNAYMKSKGGVG
jgi:hypothetical protein